MRLRPSAHNSHAHLQKTNDQSGKPEETGNPTWSFSEMSRLFGGRAGNRARPKSARLSALRLSLCAISKGTNREPTRSGKLRRNRRRSEIRRYFAFSRNGQLQGPAEEISGKDGPRRRRNQRIWNARWVQGRDCRHGFWLSCRNDGRSCWRKNHAHD